MSAHTPTPWKLDSSKKYRVVAGKPNVDSGTVASCASYDNASSAEANAAFIVRACNSHEALVDALTSALAGMTLQQRLERGRCDKTADGWDELIYCAQAALKLAKG